MKNFGVNLKKIRTRRKISQMKLAARTGLSSPYIVQLENNTRSNPSMFTVQRIADALGVKMSDLMK